MHSAAFYTLFSQTVLLTRKKTAAAGPARGRPGQVQNHLNLARAAVRGAGAVVLETAAGGECHPREPLVPFPAEERARSDSAPCAGGGGPSPHHAGDAGVGTPGAVNANKQVRISAVHDQAPHSVVVVSAAMARCRGGGAAASLPSVVPTREARPRRPAGPSKTLFLRQHRRRRCDGGGAEAPQDAPWSTPWQGPAANSRGRDPIPRRGR